MYPLRGNLQDLSQKRGVEVDVKGWGDVMEGASRRKSLCSACLYCPPSSFVCPPPKPSHPSISVAPLFPLSSPVSFSLVSGEIID
jgi:hypothetical protein